MKEFELSYRNTLDLSITAEGKDRFKTKLKDIVLLSFKLFSDNFKFENKRNDKRFNNRAYSLFFLLDIFLNHLQLIPNILK